MVEKTDKLAELRRKKGVAITRMQALVAKEEAMDEGQTLSDDEKAEFEQLKTTVADLNDRMGRIEDTIAAQAEAAADIGAGDGEGDAGEDGEKSGAAARRRGVAAQPKERLEKGTVVAGAAKMMVAGGGTIFGARAAAKDIYGERHPVTRALVAGTGPAGGFLVPPDYVAEVIELLRPMTVVRSSNPRTLPMPRGTMTLPRQNQAATAGYGGEVSVIPASQQTLGQIVATYKKLTALVPVSNDLLRYSDPSIDALVRDDLTEVLARAEDVNFIRSDGTGGSPKGFRTFCLPTQQITSTPAFTYATAASELGGAINKLESANVPIRNPVWLMNPRSKNYLYNVQNTIGAYIYQPEMKDGTLLGIPFKTTTQIPINLTVGSNSDCSEIYLVEMSQAMILDSMTLEIGVSREASYIDQTGATVNTFQQDQSLIRAIAEHDFQMRHDEAIVMITGVRYAPAIS